MTGMPAGWRDVPMPRGVAALSRTTSGIPISYTVAWSSEKVPERRFDPLVQADALFHSGSAGEGRPQLTTSDIARTRRVAVLGLCQVCGQRLPGKREQPWRQTPRWLADLRNFGQTMKVGVRTVPLVVDGWTCEPCLRYALRVCPGLVSREHHGHPLRLLRVRRADLVLTMERVPALGDDRPVVGWVKVAPLEFDVVDPDDLIASSQATSSDDRRGGA